MTALDIQSGCHFFGKSHSKWRFEPLQKAVSGPSLLAVGPKWCFPSEPLSVEHCCFLFGICFFHLRFIVYYSRKRRSNEVLLEWFLESSTTNHKQKACVARQNRDSVEGMRQRGRNALRLGGGRSFFVVNGSSDVARVKANARPKQEKFDKSFKRIGGAYPAYPAYPHFRATQKSSKSRSEDELPARSHPWTALARPLRGRQQEIPHRPLCLHVGAGGRVHLQQRATELPWHNATCRGALPSEQFEFHLESTTSGSPRFKVRNLRVEFLSWSHVVKKAFQINMSLLVIC